MDEKEAYHYLNYLQNLKDAKLKIVPGPYTIGYTPWDQPAYVTTGAFIQGVQNASLGSNFDDFFKQKVNLSEDRIGLILGEIGGRDSLKYDNLRSLYDDLLRVDNWRLERPFPDNYKKDKTWLDLNKMELQIHDQIRRELKDSARDIAFPNKDLREGLLEFKLQSQKQSQMVEGGLEMELDSSNNQQTGGQYFQNQPKQT